MITVKSIEHFDKWEQTGEITGDALAIHYNYNGVECYLSVDLDRVVNYLMNQYWKVGENYHPEDIEDRILDRIGSTDVIEQFNVRQEIELYLIDQICDDIQKKFDVNYN